MIKAHILSDIGPKIRNNPYLYRLRKEGEDAETFANLSPEELLLRWFNFHLSESKFDRRIANFNVDLKDANNYTVLLNQLSPNNCDLNGMEMDTDSRAGKVIKDASKIGVPPIIKGKDITSANNKINFIYCAHIYSAVEFGGLKPKDPPPPEEVAKIEELKKAFDKHKMENDKDAGTREERSLVAWANAQGIDGLFIRDPKEDFTDGLALLKLIEKLNPGVVDWKKVEMKPNMKVKKIGNCNYAVELGKQIGL